MESPEQPGAAEGLLSFQYSSPTTDAKAALAIRKATADTGMDRLRESSASSGAASAGPSRPGKEAFAGLPLTAEQRIVMRAIAKGKSVFFTGAAGCGKSVLLRRIIASLPRSSTAVTAPTGVAACNVGGTTLHAFAGVGRPDAGVRDMVSLIRRSPESVRRWRSTRVLIIDEVSMLDGDALDALEEVARRVRGDNRPFGGILLVLAGDFLQLKPVSKGSSRKPYAFEAKCWSGCIEEQVELTRVFRQTDGAFVRILNDLRWGIVTPEASSTLQSRWGAPVELQPSSKDKGPGPAIKPTLLFTHRADVDSVNARELDGLAGPDVLIRADDDAGTTPAARAALDSACPAPAELRLRIGAQVMLVRNLDVATGLVNGARGVITGFTGSLRYPTAQFASGDPVQLGRETFVVRTATGRVPLRLGFAISIHKSQGTTLDAVCMSLSRVFEAGQAYVALSRARSLGGLSLTDRFDAKCIRACPVAVDFYRAMRLRQGKDIPVPAPLRPNVEVAGQASEAAGQASSHRVDDAAACDAGPIAAASHAGPIAAASDAAPTAAPRTLGGSAACTVCTAAAAATSRGTSSSGASSRGASSRGAAGSPELRRNRRRPASELSPMASCSPHAPPSHGNGGKKKTVRITSESPLRPSNLQHLAGETGAGMPVAQLSF
jgi:ATP-dependent DNA helicase PIF1